MWLTNERSFHQLRAVVLLVIILLTSCCQGEEVLKRRRRFLAYPTNSCTGVLVAIAIPLGLAHRNVFVSYNFEANYNMPTSAPDLIPGPLKRLEYLVENDRSFKGYNYNATNRIAAEPPTDKSPLISRIKIYKLIESKINGLNLNGHKCLLRLICEAAHAKEVLFDHNGVIGDVLHILLTPSSTPEEGSPQYNEAELNGQKGECGMYRKGCAVKLLDYFTSFI